MDTFDIVHFIGNQILFVFKCACFYTILSSFFLSCCTKRLLSNWFKITKIKDFLWSHRTQFKRPLLKFTLKRKNGAKFTEETECFYFSSFLSFLQCYVGTDNNTTYGIFISLQKGYAGDTFSATKCLTLKMYIHIHIYIWIAHTEPYEYVRFQYQYERRLGKYDDDTIASTWLCK